MTLFLVLIALHILSILLAFWGLKRLYRYIKRYRFTESQYSLLFGFMHLRYFMVLHVVSVAWTAFVALFLGQTFL